ncbi:hypothetical protein F5B22DRAFT_452345 [Xylaria bambusicola]|uniref:uncharacterized protein n=1 Tax=Xylaria bambusicola TaxID=326684 RepID=UPI002007366D|nr:uncharacterized protein F5B22DRAFT_452345 [Xylaria bambusicola]KAI0506388.1 hypothetical protein F5B22DRAFT_452345 [Xylaria bambusicola]
MLVQSRLSGAGAQWRQMSKVGKTTVISLTFFFILALLWGTGTVDVDYVRNQFTSMAENHGDEPIPHSKVDTPIIDGVPNDQNDRIPDEIIEGAATKSSTSSATKIEHEKEKDKPTPTVVATPHAEVKPAKTESVEPVKSANTEPAKEQVKPIAGGIPLRIMFIGASMTLGTPPQAAYRKQLREWLVALGNPVNCVGTNRFGKFKDNDVQAYPATPIQVLLEKAQDAIPAMQPNLVIINAGSSDCFQEKHYGSAHGYDYTRDLVDFIFDASPNATVILSTLITSPRASFERCIKSMNAQIRQVAHDVSRQGKKILLSEQHWDQGIPGRVTPEFVSKDEMHPTFEGWAMMGEIFKQDILDVDAKGWIVAPVENGIMDDGDAERDLEEATATKANGGKASTDDGKSAANPARRSWRSGMD